MPLPSLAPIDAIVFDAYGTLFDVSSAAARWREALGTQADAISATWRRKQLEYSWLRSLMGAHADFWQLTAAALDYACERHAIVDASLRQRLLETYREPSAYPEVPSMLRAIRGAGFKTAILSNGAPSMLQAAVEAADLAAEFDAILSVESVGVFKPHPSVYQLAVDRLGVAAGRILFRQLERMGHCGRRPFRIPRGLDQSRGRAARAPAGGTRIRPWRSLGIAAAYWPQLRMEA